MELYTFLKGKSYVIKRERSELGINIPVNYQAGQVSTVLSPFVPPQSRIIPEIDKRTSDFTLDLNSVMDMTSMSMPATESGTMDNMMRWTINGKSYPDTDPIKVKLSQVIKSVCGTRM